MKKWSYWAAAHIQAARWLVALASMLLITLGIEIGFGLAAWDLELPAILVGVLTLSLPVFMYFSPKNSSYAFRRKVHFAFCTAIFLGAIAMGNFSIYAVEGMEEAGSARQGFQPESSLVHKVSQKAPEMTLSPKHVLSRGIFQLKATKKYGKALKARVKQIKKRYRNLAPGAAFGLFLLAAFGGLLLTYVIVALACAFACSELAGLAVLFGILAIASAVGTLFLLVYAFYRLFEKPERNPSRPPRAPRPVPNKSPKG